MFLEKTRIIEYMETYCTSCSYKQSFIRINYICCYHNFIQFQSHVNRSIFTWIYMNLHLGSQPEVDTLRPFKIEVVLLGDHVTLLFTGIRRNMEDTAGSNPQSSGFTEKFKSWLSWSWTYVCFIWLGMVLIMIYVLWSPLKLQETLTSGKYPGPLASYC